MLEHNDEEWQTSAGTLLDSLFRDETDTIYFLPLPVKVLGGMLKRWKHT